MEAIVEKVLGNYLNKFIKGFNKEMLSLQIMKGQATMKDFELNGEILQELMMLPTNLEVISAKCTQLDMTIPYMNLKHDPITIILDRIDLELVEPDVIKPMPNTLQNMNKRNLTEKAEKMSIIKGVRLEVKKCHLTVRTLGRNTFHPDWKPSLVVEVNGLVIQSTDDKWEVVDLEKTFILDKEKNIEKAYKQAKIEAISVYSIMTASETPTPILENIPAELRFITFSDSRTGLWISSSLEMLFEELNFSWTQGNWQRMADLGLSIQACFAREIPEREGLDEKARQEAKSEKMNKVSYGFNINRFVIELLKGQHGGEEGYTCFGFGLQTTLSPPRLTEYVIKDLGGRGADQKVECWESILEASIASITLRERKPSPEKEAPYNRLLTQVLDTKNPDTFKPPNSALIAMTVTHRTKVACDEILKRRVPTIELAASMNGMQVVFDKKAWMGLFSFVYEGPVEAGLELGSHKLLEKAHERSIEDIKNYYHINAKFDFLAAETVMIIPPVVESEAVTKAKDLRNHAMHMHLRKLTITNQPDWPFPPFLKDALVHLPQRSHSLTPAEGTIHKFQGELHNLSLFVNELTEKGERKEVILQPATLRFYGRYFPPDSDEIKLHRIEAMFHSSEIYGRVTTEMARYFHHLEEEHRKWGILVTQEELERRRVNKMMQAAASGVSEMKSSDMGDKKLLTVTRESIDKAEEYAIATARYFLENLHTTAFVKFEKGSFEGPSPGAIDSMFRQFLAEEKGLEASAEKEKEIASSRPDVTDWDNSMMNFQFEKFEAVADNNITSQTAVLSLRSLEASGVDHPKMLASASIRCIPGRTGPTNCFEFRASRDCSGSAPHITTLNTRLLGLQVLSVGKPGGLQKGLLDILPDMKDLFGQAMTKYKGVTSETKEEAIGYLKESIVRAHDAASKIIDGGLEGLISNLVWKVEVGETEYLYLPPGEGERKPIGQLLLASSNKDSLESQFKDVESQLINTKLALAQSEAEKYDLQNQGHQAGEQVKKVREEMKGLESQLVNTKFQLAEFQMENDNLKSEMKRLQEELASRPAGGAEEKKGGVSSFFGRKK